MWHGVQQATMVGWTMAKMRGMRWCWLAMLAVGQPVSAQRALPSVGGLANDVTQTVPPLSAAPDRVLQQAQGDLRQ
ncbi:peptidase S8, partial [Xanthomonas oryzae pv. oryzae]